MSDMSAIWNAAAAVWGGVAMACYYSIPCTRTYSVSMRGAGRDPYTVNFSYYIFLRQPCFGSWCVGQHRSYRQPISLRLQEHTWRCCGK